MATPTTFNHAVNLLVVEDTFDARITAYLTTMPGSTTGTPAELFLEGHYKAGTLVTGTANNHETHFGLPNNHWIGTTYHMSPHHIAFTAPKRTLYQFDMDSRSVKLEKAAATDGTGGQSVELIVERGTGCRCRIDYPGSSDVDLYVRKADKWKHTTCPLKRKRQVIRYTGIVTEGRDVLEVVQLICAAEA